MKGFVRVGRSKNKVILDDLGTVVATFENSELAHEYVHIKNTSNNPTTEMEDYARRAVIADRIKSLQSINSMVDLADLSSILHFHHKFMALPIVLP